MDSTGDISVPSRRRPLALIVLFQASEISIGRLTVQYFNRLSQVQAEKPRGKGDSLVSPTQTHSESQS